MPPWQQKDELRVGELSVLVNSRLSVSLCRTFVFAVKALDSAGGIDKLLFACIKRMTIGADVDGKIALCRERIDHMPARTGDASGSIVWVVCRSLHDATSFSNRSCIADCQGQVQRPNHPPCEGPDPRGNGRVGASGAA